FKVDDQKKLTDLCASFQETVTRWLVEKTINACRYKKVKEIVVGGGVSANSRLRELLKQEAEPYGIRVRFPSFALTLDNAAMIARRGYELYKQGRHSDWEISADPNLAIGES
ncbi:MAG: tRNA (adenosine(37)-N6)-threonylcarbamoyltransferase complex transferase subunit TsaD, partial [Candidatus Omnitrophica bacterium]|nr:tRNA (adenosine(37)-N6)-threonylcarbamoyltransferase complex transferase subunit TsaD [Candidatus Omnitrophota bacterium]